LNPSATERATSSPSPSPLPGPLSSSLRIAGVALLAAASLALGGCAEPDAGPRTILFVSIDTARADTVRFDDPSTTPNMSALAERGVIFDEAVSGTSWTLPSHVQMFTGQDPQVHGVNFDDVQIDPRTPTLAQLLQEDGWFTAGVFSGWYLIKDYGFARGFDIYENGMDGGTAFERELREARRIEGEADRAEAMAAIWDRADRVSHEGVTSPTVVEKAIGAIDSAADEDLFLFVHLFDPHYDYVPPPEIARRFDPDYTGTMTGRNFFHNPAVWDKERKRRVIGDRDLEHVKALYRGEVYFTDDYIGRLLDHLDAVGRLDDTFVVIVGDHGEEFFEHGGRGHRNTLFEEQLRVPMLMVPPRRGFEGAARGSVVDAQTSLSDLVPTLTEVLGLTAEHATGRSLVGALRGEPLESRPERAFLKPFPDIRMGGEVGARGVQEVYHHYVEAWRTPDAKFTRHFVYRSVEGTFVAKEAWFTPLDEDPAEQTFVTDPTDERFLAAWERMEELNARARSLVASQERSEDSARVSMANDLLGGVLEELGYAEGAGPTDGSTSIPQASYEVPWGLAPPPAIPLEEHLESLLRR